MSISITNKSSGNKYDILRLESYDIENAMDIPADHFSLQIGNIGGIYSTYFDSDDIVSVSDEEYLFVGIVDDFKIKWDSSGNYLYLDGRDKALLLLDNDAEPRTYYNLTLEELIKKLAIPFGFTSFDIAKTKSIAKIVVDLGESVWDVMFRICRNQGYWLWIKPDGTIVAQTLNYSALPSYVFSNSEINALPIESLEKTKSSAKLKSEIWVRAQGEKTIIAKKKDQSLYDKGFIRRLILEDPDSDNYKEAEKKAEEELKDSKKGSLEIVIETRGNKKILTNTTAKVIDPKSNTDGVFFIVGVRHIKNRDKGNITVVRLRPLWEGL